MSHVGATKVSAKIWFVMGDRAVNKTPDKFTGTSGRHLAASRELKARGKLSPSGIYLGIYWGVINHTIMVI